MADEWVDACAADDIEEEDVIRFDHGARTFAIYRTDDDRYFATDGLCTHEQVHLADGLVMGAIIECPKHNGRFDFRTGAAKGAPACVNLATYPVKVEGGRVFQIWVEATRMADAGIVIIGAGEAGARAAITLRAEGYAGALTLIGDERHAPYERPPLSKATIVGESAPTIPTIGDAAALADLRIDHLTSRAVASIDKSARRVTLSDRRALGYDKLLLATGAKPRRLSLPGGDAAITLRNFDNSIALRGHMQAGRRIAIIGGGFIGLELASSACALGCKVALIEAAPRILMRGVPSAIADIVAARHRAAEIDLIVGAAIAHISPAGDGHVVTLADGRAIPSACVIAGIGAAPEIALAAAAGLTIDNGVAVDGQLRTSDPHIYAAGDCASFPHPLYDGRRIRLEAWRNAFDQGAFVAKTMLGARDDYQAVPWFWSDQHDLNLQIAGLVDEGPELVARDLGDGALLLFHLTADGRLAAASEMGRFGKIGREVRLAEMLIAKRARPNRDALASPGVKLKSLLAA